ncbi:helix-turn-helix transcriptional regulator [Actinomadura barringtoniae]|uniref:Helix-turn-helix transcriptional regulator n=1 Tax=Actinomadura barringtoniae TaxID=1427535 RepID=A0A939PD62_9ACTN|nr:helix-turn-helix domain-containing protein [Actinomadura barringtoniae]MBO2450178.1 helix-turn-helix transcriptional regulator [Actinomadura barringtoniae]
MALGKDYAWQDCSLARALEVVGERWTLLIVRDALYGVRRFSDFRAHLDVPKAVLADRLQKLVDAGVLDKNGHEYLITPMGKGLWPIVHGLARWGEELHEDSLPARLFFHVACGAHIDADGRCPTCGVLVVPDDIEMRPGPGSGRRTDPVSLVLRQPHRMLAPIRTGALTRT